MMKGLEPWIERDQGRRLRVRIGFNKSFNASSSEAVLAVTLATEGRRMFDAYRFVRSKVLELRGRTGVDIFPEVAAALQIPLAELERHRERAAQLANDNDAKCKSLHETGHCVTPMLVVAGRQLDSSLGVIETLLEESPELLELALRSSEPGAAPLRVAGAAP
jgi:hypothetical protein